MNQIKALIFDLDGTAIPNKPDGFPSPAVIEAVSHAAKKIKVGCATGRELPICKHIIEKLAVNAPCIISGGSQIIDYQNLLPIWEILLTSQQLRSIVNVARDFPFTMMSDSANNSEALIAEYTHFVAKPIVYIVNVPKDVANDLVTQLLTVDNVAVHAVTAWTPGNVDVHITNKHATKKHALEYWLSMQQLEPHEVMAVGDSNNDLPLFELAGLKVAMGNATDELKAQADWIAPSVSDDGLAAAIHKFVLQ